MRTTIDVSGAANSTALATSEGSAFGRSVRGILERSRSIAVDETSTADGGGAAVAVSAGRKSRTGASCRRRGGTSASAGRVPAAITGAGPATIDGATTWQRFRYITYPLLTPIIAVVMTFSVLFTFTDFQLIWVLTRGGPVNATQLMATLSYQRAIIAGQLGEGAAISTAMIPFLLAAILISWFGLQRRKWQQGESND